jgi:2-polyprenyl-3-methyl-5-hydroxy-6-metoxy-1,4-benzoquinol methylase
MGAARDEVLEQARAAAAIAPASCAATACAWYHGTWPTLRALGLVASPQRHQAFFTSALAEAPGDRVLVTGSADGAMVEVVLTARPGAAVTVMDRCATPVAVAAAAAARRGATVEGWVADVLDTDERAGTFDAVVTHGLFGLVPVDRRSALAAAWAALLAPGGRLVTTTSISGPGAVDPMTFSADAVDGFAERATEAAGDRGSDLGMHAVDVAAAAREWARRAKVHPVRSLGDVASVLRDAGLQPTVELREVSGTLPAGASGPWSARSACYAEVVAVRSTP